MRERNEKAVQAMRAFLEALGLDLEQCGMGRTPERVAGLYADLFDGLGKDSNGIWGERFPSETKGIVAVRHIPFYSVCEHHLLPFFGEVSLAYLPHDGEVAGFSKFVKLVECYAHRPQRTRRRGGGAALHDDARGYGQGDADGHLRMPRRIPRGRSALRAGLDGTGRKERKER